MSTLQVLLRAGRQWNANNDLRWGAGLAYYALFSIAPLLILAIDMAGLFFGVEAARGEVQQWLGRFLDPGAAEAIGSMIASAGAQRDTTWARLLGYGILLGGALGVFLHMRAALCAIWRLPPPSSNDWLALVLDYAFALLMVVVVGLLLIVSLAAAMIVPILQAFVRERLPAVDALWQLVEIGLSALFLTLLFAAIYRVLSGRRISWRSVWLGAAVAALLFSVGKTLLSYYVVFTGTASAYGAAGSIVVFLVWVYYSSQILFFGAELIQARRKDLGEATAVGVPHA